MSRENLASENRAAAAASRMSILRVWDIVNRHFESTLATSERSATKTRAELNVRSQVQELRDLMGACSRQLKTIETYLSEMQRQETGGSSNSTIDIDDRPSRQTPYSELAGEWHFLYMEDNSVFGYMRLIPDTVSVATAANGTVVTRASFTIPPGVLREAHEASVADYDGADRRRSDYALCPCCKSSFKVSEFWKHALLEIAERGNRVPAWQSLDRSRAPRWIVEESAGWSNPIYRPRRIESTCEIEQSLAELKLTRFLSDGEFSLALDSAFHCLASQLRT